MKFWLSVAGMALLIEGIPYFLFPRSAKGVLAYLQALEEPTLRTVGLALILLGVATAFLGRI